MAFPIIGKLYVFPKFAIESVVKTQKSNVSEF